MILVTGGAGFIGSALVWKLNESGRDDIVIVDRLGTGHKWKNIAKRRFHNILHVDDLFDWLGVGDPKSAKKIKLDAIFHIGACSSTTEMDADYLIDNNTHFSQTLWQYAVEHDVPFIYASSAATYGDGEMGYSDDPKYLNELKAINPYGYSKKVFDSWVLRQKATPPFWAGLKFFNVFGPNEYHKGAQASVIFSGFSQIKENGKVRLFKSYRDGIAHGEQKRDFVYVKDVVDVMMHFFVHGRKKKVESGIYNLGTGKARSFLDLAAATFAAMGQKTPKIEWIEMPEGIKNQYQYFTEANMQRLKVRAGYTKAMTSLEQGVTDYVQNYLSAEDPYL